MSIYTLPYSVEIEGKTLPIRNDCDFRVVLDVIEALNDNDLTEEEKYRCALFIFYGDEIWNVLNLEEAIEKMFIVINCGEKSDEPSKKPKLMDWHHDFSLLAPPISKVLGYDVRTPHKFTHWWTFVGGYMEIGDCSFSNVVSIRSKKAKGRKLDKSEEEFYRENRNLVDFPVQISREEQEILDSDW